MGEVNWCQYGAELPLGGDEIGGEKVEQWIRKSYMLHKGKTRTGWDLAALAQMLAELRQRTNRNNIRVRNMIIQDPSVQQNMRYLDFYLLDKIKLWIIGCYINLHLTKQPTLNSMSFFFSSVNMCTVHLQYKIHLMTSSRSDFTSVHCSLDAKQSYIEKKFAEKKNW